MPQDSARHQHRHFKTLILLVISTTGGTFFLFWADQLAPTQRPQTLQGLAATAPSPWNGINVRTESRANPGFFHFRIDPSGRLFQSSAWRTKLQAPGSEGVIHVVLSRPRPDRPPSKSQAEMLARIVDRLQRQYRIPGNRISAAPRPDTVAVGHPID